MEINSTERILGDEIYKYKLYPKTFFFFQKSIYDYTKYSPKAFGVSNLNWSTVAENHARHP